MKHRTHSFFSLLILTVLILSFVTACGNTAPAPAAETSGVQTSGTAETSAVPAPSAATEPAAESTGAQTSEAAQSTAAASVPAVSTSAPATTAAAANSAKTNGTLVVFFSATGTTKGVAEKIAAIENAAVYEITAAEPYSDADLNWNDRNSRSTKEQNDKKARPAIGSKPADLTGITKIYIGFPIWWGEEPRIMDTFVESYSFEGITLIPFCTSSSSGIGRSGQNLAEHAGSGTWLDGKRFSGSVSEADLRKWIEGLK